MQIEGSHEFDLPRETLWEYLMDPDVIAKTIPGCEEMRAVGEDTYEARLSIGIATVKGVYTSTIQLLDKVPPERLTIKMEGKGARGFLNGEVHIALEAQDGKTLMRYTAHNQVGGAIAAVGQRIVGSAAKMLIRQGFKALEKQIAERRGSQA